MKKPLFLIPLVIATALLSLTAKLPEMKTQPRITAKDFVTPSPTPTPRPTPSPVLKVYNEFIDYVDSLPTSYTVWEKVEEYPAYLTAYCACSKCCWPSTGITASGTEVHWSEDPFDPDSCAIDPAHHSFGDVFMLDNGRLVVAEDTGSAVHDWSGGRVHIDVYLPDHSDVVNFETRKTTIWRVEQVTYYVPADQKFNYRKYLEEKIYEDLNGKTVQTTRQYDFKTA